MNAAILGSISAQLGGTVSHGILVLDIAPATLTQTVRSLKSTFGFDMLLDVTAIDWPAREPRFDVVWHFYSTLHRVRVRVKS